MGHRDHDGTFDEEDNHQGDGERYDGSGKGRTRRLQMEIAAAYLSNRTTTNELERGPMPTTKASTKRLHIGITMLHVLKGITTEELN